MGSGRAPPIPYKQKPAQHGIWAGAHAALAKKRNLKIKNNFKKNLKIGKEQIGR